MSPTTESSAIPLSRLRARSEAAMLAAASGDALGWPVEPRGQRVGGTRSLKPDLAFFPWKRREGGGYAPHQRLIPAGTYSDDTQLMLAVARSLLAGDDWWRHLTRVELPLWPFYELGGGGAVKRAAQSWAKGEAPWGNQKEAVRYFSAGANGVAMRILPHAIWGAQDESFDRAALRIAADGITTHGHPRALVGGLATGYAQWIALKWEGKIGYGDLIHRCLDEREVWSRLPAGLDDLAPDWSSQADLLSKTSYRRTWDISVQEMLGLLDACARAIGRGSLARDNDVLDELGIFGKEGGSGTRTAAAAIYLASRYLARPPAGLLAAAFARKADTDTIACVTGSLLGALTDVDWLAPLAPELQDAAYIRQVAHDVAERQIGQPSAEEWHPNLKRQIMAQLRERGKGNAIELPIFGHSQIEQVETPATKSANAITIRWLQTELGQRLAVTDITKKPHVVQTKTRTANRVAEDQLTISQANPPDNSAGPGIWTSHYVRSLEGSLRVYRDLLGLPVKRQSPAYVVLGSNLVLELLGGDTEIAEPHSAAQSGPAQFESRHLIGVQLTEGRFRDAYQRVSGSGLPVSDLIGTDQGPRFRLIDPDGHVVEVRSRSSG